LGAGPRAEREREREERILGLVSIVLISVARSFLVQNTKTGKTYQITTKYTKCL
jgi:hypothetical protein